MKRNKIEGRTTVYNRIVTPEKMKEVNQENIQLEEDFFSYLSSIDTSESTMYQYKNNLHIFWCWNLENNKNKFFVDLSKRDIVKLQNHMVKVWCWSPKRIRTFKATLSSLSKYIVDVLDDEYPNFKSIINVVKSPENKAVREKSVFTEDELQKMLDALVEDGLYDKACLLSLVMNNGRRKAELTRFKVSYFDKSNLICEGALYKTPEKMKTKGHGADGKLLDVYTLAKPFQPYLDLWLEERKRLGIKSDWLFPKKVGGIYCDKKIAVTTFDSWIETLNRYASKFTDKHYYLHCSRHYLTTKLLESNIPSNVVKEMIGWDSLDMVELYNDQTKESKFGKYFGAEGIKTVEQSSLKEL